MGFSRIVRRGVATADRLTDDLQDTVLIYPWIGIGTYSEPVYGTVNPQKAIVLEKEFQRKLSGGQEVTQRAEVTIPRPIAAQGAAERREPIDPRDKIVLPSGYTGPILDVAGLTDPLTHAPYMFTIILG